MLYNNFRCQSLDTAIGSIWRLEGWPLRGVGIDHPKIERAKAIVREYWNSIERA